MTRAKPPSARRVAVDIMAQLLRQQGSLASLVPQAVAELPEADQRLARELCYGCSRWYPYLDAVLAELVSKPLKPKDSDIKALLLLGLYQLEYTRIADHAAIHESVELTKRLKKAWASKLVNGVLRRFQRDKAALLAAVAENPTTAAAHPDWLIDQISSAWPDFQDAIIEANNHHPPLVLRVNRQGLERADFIARLAGEGINAEATAFSDQGVLLTKPHPVTQLPGFSDGWFSVQDEAAQLAAGLLELAPGQRVLDACCAPGGKTCHIAETEPGLAKLDALDIEQRRLVRVRENLARLGVKANVLCGDAAKPTTWWDGECFDRILLDAPCSATGIIRRQPDIKLLREPAHIEQLADLQQKLLANLWPLLAEGGLLLYATCSIMPAENSDAVKAFIDNTSDAEHQLIDAPWGIAQTCGRQLLPQVGGHDGFFYACIRKRQAASGV